VLNRDGHLAAVLGAPVAHSLSPALHHGAYRALGLHGWRYGAYEVREGGLAAFVAGLGPEWAGLSLTMPLKEVAFDVVEEVSAVARDVGAINTLVRRPDNAWAGHNTDVEGVLTALTEAGVDRVEDALVLGSGATARSVLAALRRLGARRVTFAVRGEAREPTVAHAERIGLDVHVRPLADVPDLVGRAGLVVSTLPAGAADDLARRLSAGPAAAGGGAPVLFDVVYAGWPTPLARTFGERGGVVVSGFEMLLHQAAAQVRLMTGLEPPVEAMRAAGRAAMAAR
jgi:shikimate dehydrogenase